MKKIGFLRKSPTYGNDCDYSNVSKAQQGISNTNQTVS